MVITLSLVALIFISYFLYTRQQKFGRLPSGERLLRMQQSPNYKDGKFRNLVPTPTLTEGYTMPGIIADQFLTKVRRRTPVDPIPFLKTDLLHLSPEKNILVWFGHSSYFMQVEGKTFLVDPVFSGNASPLPRTIRAFKGTDIYTVDDLPAIDWLIISHDHYDHLDYTTISALKNKVGAVICGLGVGAHFERWGYAAGVIQENDWNEEVELAPGFQLFTLPARHKSGRSFKQDNTLWLSYMLLTPTLKIFIGGDSGYGPHFKDIGKKFGPVDLAILENGQYNLAWHYIHTLPEETLQAAKDLQAKRIFPVHAGKFRLGNHPWDEPYKEIIRYNETFNIPMVTPVIGEAVDLKNEEQKFAQWWLNLN